MIDPSFGNINRLIGLSCKAGDMILQELRFIVMTYMSLVAFKDFDTLIDNKLFLDQHVKDKQEGYEKLVEMSRTKGYTRGNRLD